MTFSWPPGWGPLGAGERGPASVGRVPPGPLGVRPVIRRHASPRHGALMWRELSWVGGGRARLSPASVVHRKVKKELTPGDGHPEPDETTAPQDLQEARRSARRLAPVQPQLVQRLTGTSTLTWVRPAARLRGCLRGVGGRGQQAGPGPGVLQAPTGTLGQAAALGRGWRGSQSVNQGAWPENAGSMLGRAPAGRVRAVDPIVSSRREHRLLPASAPEAKACTVPPARPSWGSWSLGVHRTDLRTLGGGVAGRTSGPRW